MERCTATYNPGRWPYVTRCVITSETEHTHVDRDGNEFVADTQHDDS